MATNEGFDLLPIRFDDRGRLNTRAEFDAFIERARTDRATDAIFIAHGFRNDENDATRLYTSFFRTFKAHLSRPEFTSLSSRRFIVAAVYWPSKPFRENFEDSDNSRARRSAGAPSALVEARTSLEELKQDDSSPAEREAIDRAIALLPTLDHNVKAQDEFVKLLLSLLDGSSLDETEGLPQIRQLPGSAVLAALNPQPDGTRGISDVAGGIAGGLGQFLNLTTWYVMKNRSGTVGATGVAEAIRALHASMPELRIHVVGHSLGGRLAAAVAKALCKPPKLELDSLLLLEAAFSHFGFSENNGRNKTGFFRDVVVHQVVKGPFVSTFSAQDTVVGKAYSIMSRLAGDDTRAIGDEHDEFGGLGRNGPLKTREVSTARMTAAGTPYQFKDRVINNLDGSGGFIKDHGDVTNESVTYAFASAVART